MQESITKQEAIELAREIFPLLSEHRSKAYEHYSRASEHRSKAYSLLYKILSKKEIVHAVPDKRAFNIRCADRKEMVYCFVWTRRELWVYDGECCPTAETVKKIEWEK